MLKGVKDYFDHSMPSTIDLNTWDTSELTDMSQLLCIKVILINH